MRTWVAGGTFVSKRTVIESAVVLMRWRNDRSGPTLYAGGARGDAERACARRRVRAATWLADVEREHILTTLRVFGGNRSEAARALGIGRNTLLRKLKEYGEP